LHPCLCVIYINVSSLFWLNWYSYQRRFNKQIITATSYMHDKWMNSSMRIQSHEENTFYLPCIHVFCLIMLIICVVLSLLSEELQQANNHWYMFLVWQVYLKSIGWKSILEKSALCLFCLYVFCIIIPIVAESFLLSSLIELYCPSYERRFNKQTITPTSSLRAKWMYLVCKFNKQTITPTSFLLCPLIELYCHFYFHKQTITAARSFHDKWKNINMHPIEIMTMDPDHYSPI
jgi:hypothetical protein